MAGRVTLLVLCALLGCVGVAHATSVCKEYANPYQPSNWYPSKTAAAAASGPAVCAGYGAGVTFTGSVTIINGGLTYFATCHFPNGDQDSGSNALQQRDAACSCDTSDPTIGQTFSGSASSMATQSYCDPVSQCKVVVKQAVSATGGALYVGTKQAVSCGAEDTALAAAPDTTKQESCTTAGAYQVCASAAGGGQCGYINDNYVCLKKTVPTGGCVAFGDGSKVCESSAGTPPVPDSGTKGVKAAPSAVLQQKTAAPLGGVGTTVTYNYYSSATVSGSARDSNTGGGTVQGPDGSGGGGALDGDGSCTGGDCPAASGGDVCGTPPSCSGDPVGCAQLLQEYLARCPSNPSDSDIASAVGPPPGITGADDPPVDLSSAFSEDVIVATGSCPTDPVVDLPQGQHVTLRIWGSMCQLALMIAPVILACAYVLGGFIVIRGL